MKIYEPTCQNCKFWKTNMKVCKGDTDSVFVLGKCKKTKKMKDYNESCTVHFKFKKPKYLKWGIFCFLKHKKNVAIQHFF